MIITKKIWIEIASYETLKKKKNRGLHEMDRAKVYGNMNISPSIIESLQLWPWLEPYGRLLPCKKKKKNDGTGALRIFLYVKTGTS